MSWRDLLLCGQSKTDYHDSFYFLCITFLSHLKNGYWKKKKKYLYGCMTKLIIFKKCRVTHFLINGGTRLTVLHVVLWKRISWHNEVWCLSYEFKKWCAIWTSEGGVLEWVTWVVCLRGWHAKVDDVGDVCGLCLCVYECFISIWCNIVLIGI